MRKYTVVRLSEEERESLVEASNIIGEFKRALNGADGDLITFDCDDETIVEVGSFRELAAAQDTLNSLAYSDKTYLGCLD